MSSNKSDRLVLVDLIRLISFLSIAFFHTYSAVHYKEMDQELWRGKILSFAQIIPRLFSFSGFTIVAIFSFLRGWGPRRKSLAPKFLILVFGIAILFLTYSNIFANELFWEWDIYHYLIVVMISLYWLEKFPKFILGAGVAGFLLTWIPFWKVSGQSQFPILFQHAVFGICDSSGRGGWPLLPWIGLPLALFTLGHQTKKANNLSFFPFEIFVWTIFLFFSAFHLGAYYHVTVGPNFYCYTMRQEPWIFWCHFLWIVFFLRWSPHPKVVSALRGNRILESISNLMLSRHFALAYLLQLILIWLIEENVLFFASHIWAYDLAYLGMLPFLEIMLRLGFSAKETLIQKKN